MVTRQVFAGVDVGGTKTHIVVVDMSGEVCVDRVLDSVEWMRRTTVERASELARLVAAHVQPAGTVAGVAAGVHGVDCDRQRDVFGLALRGLCPRSIVVNDAELLPLAAGDDAAMGLIAGTGSAAISYRPDGSLVHAGGWGWLVGDDGGATGLVRDAVRAAHHLYDRGQTGQPDPLVEELMRVLAVDHARMLSAVVSEQDPRRWAAAAPAVFTAAANGSATAGAVISRHVTALAGLVQVVASHGGNVRRVVAGGGVLRHQPDYVRRVAEQIHRVVPQVTEVVLLDEAPVHGAVRLAHQVAEAPPNRTSGPFGRIR